jgi:hypothetical protein
MKIARVFPRRTSATPDDGLAFVGDPPLFRPEADEVHVSCCFTWDRPEAERLARAWANCGYKVRVGGPAYDAPAGDFAPGVYVKTGMTITSRGCIRRCPFCLVPKREGKLRTLPIRRPQCLLGKPAFVAELTKKRCRLSFSWCPVPRIELLARLRAGPSFVVPVVCRCRGGAGRIRLGAQGGPPEACSRDSRHS